MKARLCDLLGIDVPIFAFSHCRDVVAEVTKAGGMGVLGVAYKTAEQLDGELQWIDERVGGKPYGVDVLLPSKYEKLADRRIAADDLPDDQVRFMRRVLDDAGIPRLPDDDGPAMVQSFLDRINMTREQADALVDVALRHPIKAVVSALGSPPKETVERLHALGIKVGALAGKTEHALRHKAAGVDFVVAQGMEAGGHTGKVTSMILWPQLIDAVAPLPVLAAGGIGRGRQMAAALALGAEGVWCGSIWLGSRESELNPAQRRRFFAAGSDDTVQSRLRSGKPARVLRSKLSDAWERPDAPPFAPMPYQTLLMVEPHLRVERGRDDQWQYYPVGQIVGDMHAETSCRQIVYDMMNELVEATERLSAMVLEDGHARP
ncbi:MAG: nitronate monooxygenase [Rubrivivax sp.]|nr:nitronate monooxygenase [Burkholderiales bacterium]MCW5637060.1 nitronate monooxygenase [Rubrivivax sp.]